MLGPNMSDVISLRKARKMAERKLDRKRAAENRLRFGLSKAGRKVMEAREAKICRDLDMTRVETGGER
jgi:hypothetical protein